MQPWILVALALAIIVMVTCQWQLSSKARIKRFLKKHCGIKGWNDDYRGIPIRVIGAWFVGRFDERFTVQSWPDFWRRYQADKRCKQPMFCNTWFVSVACKVHGAVSVRVFVHDPRGCWTLNGDLNADGSISGCLADSSGRSFNLPLGTTIDDISMVVNCYETFWETVARRSTFAIAAALAKTRGISKADAFRIIREAAEDPLEMFKYALDPEIDIKGTKAQAE